MSGRHFRAVSDRSGSRPGLVQTLSASEPDGAGIGQLANDDVDYDCLFPDAADTILGKPSLNLSGPRKPTDGFEGLCVQPIEKLRLVVSLIWGVSGDLQSRGR